MRWCWLRPCFSRRFAPAVAPIAVASGRPQRGRALRRAQRGGGGGTERERVHHHAAAPCPGIAHAPGSALHRPAPHAMQPAGGAPSRANGWPASPGAPAPGPSVGGCFPGAQRATSVRGGPRHQACCAPELEGRWWELRGAARERVPRPGSRPRHGPRDCRESQSRLQPGRRRRTICAPRISGDGRKVLRRIQSGNLTTCS